MISDSKDQAVRSERKVICSKLAKDFSDWLHVYQQLSQEWLALEKKNVQIPLKPAGYSYAFFYFFFVSFAQFF